MAVGVGVGILVGWLLLGERFHYQAVSFARQRIASDTFEDVNRDQWEAHIHETLKGGNQDLIGTLSFVGLMMFSTFEVLSSFGQITEDAQVDLPLAMAETYGPVLFSTLLLLTCVISLMVYVRIRIAIGHTSLRLYPNDNPFRPFRLTDSLLGYILLAFLSAVSLHLFLAVSRNGADDEGHASMLITDAIAFIVSIVAAPSALFVARQRLKRRSADPIIVASAQVDEGPRVSS